LTVVLSPSTSPARYSRSQLQARVDGIILVARIIIISGRRLGSIQIGGGSSSRRRRSIVDTGGRVIV